MFRRHSSGAQVEPQRECKGAEKDAREKPEGCADAEQLGGDGGDEGSEHEAGHIEAGQATEIVANVGGIAGDHDSSNRGADGAAAQSQKQSGEHKRPELRGDRTRQQREHREHDAAPHHDGNVAAVGVAGKEELRAEAGEEPGGDDQAELRAGEAKSVAQVRSPAPCCRRRGRTGEGRGH